LEAYPVVLERRATSSVLHDGIERLLAESVAEGNVPAGDPSRPATVLDLGGGTGGLAVRLATAGHQVTVVDPSPDALAALGRRAAEAGVGDRLLGLQGDAEGLGNLLDGTAFDLVLCHGVLEVVDDPSVALRAIRRVLRDTGRLSLLVAGRHAAVLSRASAGHLRQALRLVTDPDGRWGQDDPLLRRFDLDGIHDLLERCGFAVLEAEGVRIFTDLVPRGPLDSDPAAAEVLAQLEGLASGSDTFLGIAAQLHVHAAPA
jgi:S-adenosylmethionine-dependent methyltransferase